MSPSAAHQLTARALAAALAARELSAVEVLDDHLDRIQAVGGDLNAIVTLVPGAARAAARAADRALARGDAVGPLHGLPVAVKDLEDTAGIRTTYGSRVFAEWVPATDSLLVARLRAAGAIIIGKTNTPEFGAGSHTFNAVFGATRNPWATDRSAGGSSGGAGAALAAGLVPLADGSDLGGSVRNPASFNSVCGLRPSAGLIPDPGDDDVWSAASVHGPMARTVDDLALMLEGVCGPDPRCPLSFGDPAWFAGGIRGERSLAGVRVGWLADVGGLPIEPEVAAVVRSARERMVALGAVVEDLSADLSDADHAFETFRALGFARGLGADLPRWRDRLRDTVVWNIERGLTLGVADVQRAIAARGATFRTFANWLSTHDLVVAPAAQVAPFPVQEDYPRTVAGVPMGSYLEWMRACSRITVSAHPVAAVPAGFTPAGLPVGLQLVGAWRGDRRLLELASAWEAGSGVAGARPPV